MKNNILYIDTDGVAANWVKYVLDNHFTTMTDIEELNKHKQRVKLLKQVYKKDPYLFYNLEPMQRFHEILRFIRGCKIPFKILTAVGKEHHDFKQASLDKRHWWADHFEVPHDDVIIVKDSPNKVKYAKGAVLIDDWHMNRKQWIDAGGIAAIDVLDEFGDYSPYSVIEELKKIYCTV